MLSQELAELDAKRFQVESQNSKRTRTVPVWSDKHFYGSINRAHRGKKGTRDELTIYVKVNSNEALTQIKNLRFMKKDLFINQMRSPMVRERVKKGLDIIKAYKSNPGKEKFKMYVSDSLNIMVKKPGDQKYSVFQTV